MLLRDSLSQIALCFFNSVLRFDLLGLLLQTLGLIAHGFDTQFICAQDFGALLL
ncbi:MAG: hypothetical protein RL584_436 [Pseudomonadota bacterium]